MATPEWGTKEWHDEHFPTDKLDSEGDTWGMRWRGMDKMRHASYLKLIETDLKQSRGLKVLDIGCALCDFTEKAWHLNEENQFWGIDISDNAIAWASDNFPMFTLRTGSIPDIPFDVDFDMVLCLEVLCYVSADDRRKTITNIHRILVPSGRMLLSGVLNAGPRYHTEEEIMGLVADGFDIRDITYNHWSLYRKLIERPLDAIRTSIGVLLPPLEMSNEDFQEWKSGRDRGGKKIRIIEAFRRLNPVSRWFLGALGATTRLVLGSKLLTVIFHKISGLVRGSRKADEIVILAVRK